MSVGCNNLQGTTKDFMQRPSKGIKKLEVESEEAIKPERQQVLECDILFKLLQTLHYGLWAGLQLIYCTQL